MPRSPEVLEYILDEATTSIKEIKEKLARLEGQNIMFGRLEQIDRINHEQQRAIGELAGGLNQVISALAKSDSKAAEAMKGLSINVNNVQAEKTQVNQGEKVSGGQD